MCTKFTNRLRSVKQQLILMDSDANRETGQGEGAWVADRYRDRGA